MISEFPLWAFTILSGIACGAYIAAAFFPTAKVNQATVANGSEAQVESNGKTWVFPLMVLVLVAVGGLCAVGHLGRPLQMLNVLNNPLASITMEGIFTGLLGAVALVDFFLSKKEGASPRWIRIVGGIVSVLFILVVTSAYVTSYGNPSWRALPTFPLFLLGDLSVGFALWFSLFDKKSKLLVLVSGIISALFALNLIWEGIVFAGLAQAGTGVIIAGAVIAIAQSVLSFLSWSGKLEAPWMRSAILALALLALFVSRYGFYMASII